MRKLRSHALAVIVCYAIISLSAAHGAIVVDGVLDEPEWATARVFRDFVTVEPLTVEPAKYRTEVRVIANAEGIFVGFSNYQPAAVKRVNRYFSRDTQIDADRNVVSIDFDNTALAGYDFTVGSANSQQDGIVTKGDYSADWDGTWYSQTSSNADYWYSEMHIPWSVAPMTAAKDGRKTIALWFSRVVFDESLRFAFPDAYYSRTTFMEDWHQIEVAQGATSSLEWFPYISYSHDLLDNPQTSGDAGFKSGLDFIWRPNSNTQLTGAINPDFGQVESDDLVVDFSAFETFVSEKRPFFTENQALFSSSIPGGDLALYTRRIGAGATGQDAGVVDIDIAAKLTHFGNNTDMGVFIVSEDDSGDSFGGDFLSTRVQRKVDGLMLGHRLTQVDRARLDREARLHAIDMIWQRDKRTEIRGQLLQSSVQQTANKHNQQQQIDQRDSAGWASWSYAPSDRRNHKITVSHFGDQFDMNDMGYMRRNDVNSLSIRSRFDRLQYGLDSKLLSATTLFNIFYRENTDGDRLRLKAELDQTWNYISTRKIAVQAGLLAAAVDDRITRGNGLLERPSQTWLQTGYSSPRGDNYTYEVVVKAEYDKTEKLALNVDYSPQLYINEAVTVGGNINYKRLQQWLIWDADIGQLASFDADHYGVDIRLDWYPSSRQEVRLKFQWIGIDASVIDSFDLDDRGKLFSSAIESSSFSLSDTALQIRYRYEIAPLSNIFLVYSRGGYYGSNHGDEGISSLLDAGWNDRTVESVMAKIRYRF